MNNYCVYKHKNKINGKVYIGITCQNPRKRWGRNGKKYFDSPKFYNAIQKYGWDNFEHIILYDNLSKDEACSKEIELIDFYKSNTKKYGYNITSGGEHYIPSNDIRKKISNSKMGHSTSEETKHKMSLAKLGCNHPRARKIICINTLVVYDTAIQAEIDTNIKNEHILSCCHGKIKSSGKTSDGQKIYWKFYDEFNKDIDTVENINNFYSTYKTGRNYVLDSKEAV